MSWGNRSSDALNGQHLKVIWPNWEGNPKGLLGPLKGRLMIDYLAERFHFTYEMVRVTENQVDIPVGGKGLFSYILNQECDLLVHGVVPTAERLKMIDIAAPWYYTTLEFLIPVLDDVANINAIVKPFEWLVWLLLLVSIVVVFFVLRQLRKYDNGNNFPVGTSTSPVPRCKQSDSKSESEIEAGRMYLYVFGNLLSQGGVWVRKWKRLPFRLVAGAWTLAAFIFVQAYYSTIITYVITPSEYPLIYSAYDIAKDPSIALYMRKASTGERVIMDPNSKGIYKKIRDRLNSVPDSRCTYQSDCLDHVKPGLRNVYLESYLTLVDMIKAEYESTGSCKMEIAKEPLVSIIAGFGLQKKSPYTNTISIGVLELFENGLLNHWDLWFRFMPQKCLKNIKAVTKTTTKKPGHVPLSLKNLSGSFVILAVGFTLSTLGFISERIATLFRKKQSHVITESHLEDSDVCCKN